MDNSDAKLDLIIDMLLTLCGRNLEIPFSETKEFAKRFDELRKQSGDQDG